MKVWLFILLVCGASVSALSQEIDKKNFSSQWTISIEARNFLMSERVLNDFLVKNNIKVLTQNVSLYSIRTEFTMEKNVRDSLDGLLEKLGYVAKKDYSYKDISVSIQTLEDEITQLKDKINIDTAGIDTSVQNLEKEIISKQNQAEALKKNMDKSYILLTITAEDNVEDNVTFVNMPGYEYAILFTEKPTNGISAQRYQMHAIKFLFTRGKSYFQLGMLRAMNYDRSDMTLYKEYFIFNFGQDFYTRHLGRGKRRYFNPYISYQFGGLLASRQNEENRFMPNANVALGTELIKTKIFLLDSKASYFMPLNKSFVYMRGVQLGVGANVLF